MSLYNKVIWLEGLFLQPQHFQQQDRYHESNLQTHLAMLGAYRYGLATLQIDPELLKIGKFGLGAVSGIFEDGTVFDLPTEASLPDPIDVPDDCKDMLVHVALLLNQPDVSDVSVSPSPETARRNSIRYLSGDQEVRDNVAESDNKATIKVAQLNVALQLQSSLASSLVTLPVARIVEKRADGRVVLDDTFIPVCLDVNVSRKLSDMTREIHGLLHHRGGIFAERLAHSGTKGVAEFTDFLLLQVCNRSEPIFYHLSNRSIVHPEMLYIEMMRLAGELATFGRSDRRCPEFAAYRHTDLEETFSPVIAEIRDALTKEKEATAVGIPLEDKGRGGYLADIPDVALIRSATFILAVYADVTTDQIREVFISQIKIGPVERIRDLVMSHLPGIGLRALPVAPRQIPYYAGYTYFELDRDDELWKMIEISRVIAMHVAGDFPGLKMELWAVRDR